MIVDFTDLPVRKKSYGGANGGKISVVYQNELYMLKFPGHANHNSKISYANSCISEYLGCHIFESIGVPTQKTILGVYRKNGLDKIVVACKDFTTGGFVLQDFASLKNTIVDSSNNGYGTELSDIIETIEEQTAMDPIILMNHFWDMFIVDALLGNWDRHNGNWGFLYHPTTDELKLAPVFDCGSTLYPQADEEMMRHILSDEKERDVRIYERPLSAIKRNGQKIPYFRFISSLENEDCNSALLRIFPKVDMDKISSIIDETPFIQEIQKCFYKTMIRERKEKILDVAYEALKKR